MSKFFGVNELTSEQVAANEYVASQNYGGSVEALALSQAFQAGVLTSGASRDSALVEAFRAGLKWTSDRAERTRKALEGPSPSEKQELGKRPVDGDPYDDIPDWIKEFRQDNF